MSQIRSTPGGNRVSSTPHSSSPTGTLGTASSKLTTSSTGSESPTTPTELKQGWAYAVVPPRFPIVTTPRQRGGVRAGIAVKELHVVLHADATSEHIFFVSARGNNGAETTCPFAVEGILVPSNPADATIDSGWYTERRVDMLASSWSGVRAKRISDLAPGDPLLVKLQEVLAAGPGGGGSAGGSA